MIGSLVLGLIAWILPIINTKIVKATVSSIEFDDLNNENEQSSFSAVVIYEPRDGEPIEVEESGVM